MNPSALEKAKKARYTDWSLRGTAPDIRERHFTRTGSDFVLHETLRKMVSFEEKNLLDDDLAFWQRERFDVIFCRNATMYLGLIAATVAATAR